jgi:hypothetical protein
MAGALLLLAAVASTDAFVVGPPLASPLSRSSTLSFESPVRRWASTDNKETASAFVPLEEQSSSDGDDDDDEDTLEQVELLGKGAAKVRVRGR